MTRVFLGNFNARHIVGQTCGAYSCGYRADLWHFDCAYKKERVVEWRGRVRHGAWVKVHCPDGYSVRHNAAHGGGANG